VISSPDISNDGESKPISVSPPDSSNHEKSKPNVTRDSKSESPLSDLPSTPPSQTDPAASFSQNDDDKHSSSSEIPSPETIKPRTRRRHFRPPGVSAPVTHHPFRHKKTVSDFWVESEESSRERILAIQPRPDILELRAILDKNDQLIKNATRRENWENPVLKRQLRIALSSTSEVLEQLQIRGDDLTSKPFLPPIVREKDPSKEPSKKHTLFREAAPIRTRTFSMYDG
jgi:hypothetical protein